MGAHFAGSEPVLAPYPDARSVHLAPGRMETP